MMCACHTCASAAAQNAVIVLETQTGLQSNEWRRAEGMVWIGAGLMKLTHSYPFLFLRTTCAASTLSRRVSPPFMSAG